MSREGNYEQVVKAGNLTAQDFAHSKGAWLLVLGLAAATIYSCSNDSGAQDSPFNIFQKPYLDLANCLAIGMAADGLSATCKARDGSSWRVRQSTAAVFPSEFALAESIPAALEKVKQKDTTLAWVALHNPLILTPIDAEDCQTICIVSAERPNGDIEYFATPNDAVNVRTQITESLFMTPLQPEIAVVIDQNNVSY